MGSRAKRDHLARVFNLHAQNIRETFELFAQSAAASLEKVDWSEVTKLGDEISKQATIAGMLWIGEKPDVGELEENMGVYCNMLQGFILLSHGSTVGAAPTLHACIHASVKQVVECSLSLLEEAVSFYETRKCDRRTIPQLSGSVWEACAALKKTPSTNYVAIGRAVNQVAVSVKDVLREMRELKPTVLVSVEETPAEASDTCKSHEEDGSSDGDFGDDLSPDEMIVAQLATDVVSDTLAVLKEVIRFISSSVKKPGLENNIIRDSIGSLERVLRCCQEIGVQVDELGASVYPPQEFVLMKTVVEKILKAIDGIQEEVGGVEGSSEDLSSGLERLKGSLREFLSGLTSLDGDLIPEMRCLAV